MRVSNPIREERHAARRRARRAVPERRRRANRPLIGKQTFFTLVLAALSLSPLLLSVALEIGLRVAGYGIDTRLFVIPRYTPDRYVMNVNFYDKYFPRAALSRSVPLRKMIIANRMAVNKPPHVLRGFVVGESTAQGFPYKTNQSFGKITELALAAAGKYDGVEILNLGVSAISSYCVKDIASKLLDYAPDFLVIYAGHNEYYGTISATTGGNYFTKTLYLHLRELRLFQLLFNLTAGVSPPRGTTLMEQQFNRQKVPLDPEIDGRVAADFIRNIDAIVSAYSRRHIPVIIIDPVSNLYDMPPFSGEKDDEFKSFIAAYAAAVRGPDRRNLEAYYAARRRQPQYDRNANVRYLDAVAQRILTGHPDLNSFRLAKDLDTTPFRARESLRARLRTYCNERSHGRSDLVCIPLSDLMAQMHDPDTFGNKIFIDQLHFTQAGQRLVSRVLAERIAERFHFSEQEQLRVTEFYADDSHIDQAIHYLPAYRIEAHLTVQSLMGNPPFTQMLLPYEREEMDGVALSAEDTDLVQMVSGGAHARVEPKVDPIVIADHFFKRNDVTDGKLYLDSYRWNYPGGYQPYLAEAWFGMTYDDDFSETVANFELAYALSGKLKVVYDEMAGYLVRQGREDVLHALQRQYGGPE